MKVLIACEESQVVTVAMRAAGIEAYSCDLEPAALVPQWHIQDDARKVLHLGWDMVIAHPPCDRITNTGVRWLHERDLWDDLDKACAFFKVFLDAPIEHVAVENPIPHKYAIERIGRKYDQTFQPHHFGEPRLKCTCLWLKKMPKLIRTHYMAVPKPGTPEHKLWSEVHQMPPGPNRKRDRSRTLPGVARAWATQWGVPLLTGTPFRMTNEAQ